ncbi:MAG TPA: hypothetical protein VKS98_12145 [Chthoniobacterales bacterium]|nr:hypothetical protein [Chthoniobacterales bacterium]
MNLRVLSHVIVTLIFLAGSALAANPFLDAKDDKPVSANFKGTEWNDENIDGDIPLTGRVVTTRIAKMPWGAIFKVEYVDLKSKATQKREITPDYFIVTDDRIILLNEDNNDEAAKKIAAMDKPPGFEENYVYGITTGHFKHQEGLWETKIDVKGDLCVYDSSHPSGHFKKMVWKKGVGLVQYDSGYGAAKDGWKLKRINTKG